MAHQYTKKIQHITQLMAINITQKKKDKKHKIQKIKHKTNP